MCYKANLRRYIILPYLFLTNTDIFLPNHGAINIPNKIAYSLVTPHNQYVIKLRQLPRQYLYTADTYESALM